MKKKPGQKTKIKNQNDMIIEQIRPRLVSAIHRPEAPIFLNEGAREEWSRVVNALPADWFGPETLSILTLYCEHVAEAQALQQMIETVRQTAMKNDESFKRYQDLSRQKESQTRAALSCATKMRMTHQSTYTTKAGATAQNNSAPHQKPWGELP